MEGTCNCGGITVSIRNPEGELKVSLCHCFDCRASGGSLFAVNLLVQPSNVTIGGEIKPNIYSAATAAGNESNRHFCPRCGSPIMTTITGKPDLIFVKGGMFRKHGFELDEPFKEQWFRRAEVWETAHVPESKIVM